MENAVNCTVLLTSYVVYQVIDVAGYFMDDKLLVLQRGRC